jgi:hypothetical protein
MPSPDEHRSWAERNERFFESIDGTESEWSDWAMTALFYAAVHEVQAFFLKHKAELAASSFTVPDSHKCVKLVLRTLWPSLAASYASLLDQSYRARYKCRLYSESNLQAAVVQLGMLRDEIKTLG